MFATFKSLAIRQVFRFPPITGRGLVTGPCVKLSARKYCYLDVELFCQVGTVNVEVIPADNRAPHTLTLPEFRAAWGDVYGEWTNSVYDCLCAAARAAAL